MTFWLIDREYVVRRGLRSDFVVVVVDVVVVWDCEELLYEFAERCFFCHFWTFLMKSL